MYVLTAVSELNKLERLELHNYERPITYLAYQTAELNRDRKKAPKPFQVSDFYWYDDAKIANMPEPRYGAAAMELIRRKQFPSWALFAYKELKARAEDAFPPEVLWYWCDDAIVLAPSVAGHELRGMLIAQSTADRAIRQLNMPDGGVITVRMPTIGDAYFADEEAVCVVLS